MGPSARLRCSSTGCAVSTAMIFKPGQGVSSAPGCEHRQRREEAQCYRETREPAKRTEKKRSVSV